MARSLLASAVSLADNAENVPLWWITNLCRHLIDDLWQHSLRQNLPTEPPEAPQRNIRTCDGCLSDRCTPARTRRLESDEITAFTDAGDWPTPNTAALWARFRTEALSGGIQKWSIERYKRLLDIPARGVPPAGLYRIITDEGDGRRGCPRPTIDGWLRSKSPPWIRSQACFREGFPARRRWWTRCGLGGAGCAGRVQTIQSAKSPGFSRRRMEVNYPIRACLHDLQRHAGRMEVRSAVGKVVSQGDEGLDRIGKSVGARCERRKEAAFPRPVHEIAQRATRGSAVAV